MTAKRAAKRLMIHIGESDRYRRRALHSEIVERARKAGLAGATVYRGFEGYGLDGVVHTSRILSLTADLPVVVAIVDDPDKIDAFLPVLDEVLGSGMVTIEDIDAYYYGAADPAHGAADRASGSGAGGGDGGASAVGPS